MDSNKPSSLTIGFIGASHLAYVSAVAAAEKGGGQWNIICCATGHTFEKINEPDLFELCEKNKTCIQFTTQFSDLTHCDLVYLAIDVPTDDFGDSNLDPITEHISAIKKYLNEKATLVVLSQVHPGYTRTINFDSNRLFYQVETLIFGCAVSRALHPERFIVGCNAKDHELSASLLTYLNAHNCPIFKMTYESAELAKISINMYLTATVTTTNMMAEICKKVDANWEDIAETLKLDKRIGPFAYLKPGLGIAGGNLERDMATIKKIAFEQGANIKFLKAQTEDSEYRSTWPLRTFKKLCSNKECTVGVLGIAYKENTHSIKNSASVKFIRALSQDFAINAFDPIVKSLEIPGNLSILDTAQAVIDNSDFLAILTPWPIFRSLDYSNFKGTIMDPYNLIDSTIKNTKRYKLGKR